MVDTVLDALWNLIEFFGRSSNACQTEAQLDKLERTFNGRMHTVAFNLYQFVGSKLLPKKGN